MSKIYLVDDQPISNFITKKLLEIEGYRGTVKDFTNPCEAMEFVSEDRDAIIFLDLNMPEMNGWNFWKCYRAGTAVTVSSFLLPAPARSM
ncbi:response regulator [uncultured Christiangramia sp.]|uniref:response regulator n=1 Tax=uncultured Christiangramia sp. TaxID=503836 RepID=UPI0026095AA3|nr:response regulator [uncultured Christiangramia sp.]